MSERFDPSAIRVAVPVTVVGPRAEFDFLFALDTGASRSTLRPDLLRLLGFDLTNPVHVSEFRGVTGGGRSPAVTAPRVTSLGVTRTNFLLHAQNLPLAVTVDGLLGLDFLRSHVLTLDFARGRMRLRPPGWWHFWR